MENECCGARVVERPKADGPLVARGNVLCMLEKNESVHVIRGREFFSLAVVRLVSQWELLESSASLKTCRVVHNLQ